MAGREAAARLLDDRPAPDARPELDDRPAPDGSFTRDELDTAEPERPPSTRFRWLVGIGLGAFGAALTGWPLGLLCLPFALTAAGAGALIGTGLTFVAWSAFSLVVWLNGDLTAGDVPALTAWSAASLVALGTGIAGTVVVARRSRGGTG